MRSTMKVVVLDQRSPEWLAWRMGGIGSSDALVIAAAAGMIDKRDWMKSLDDLYEEKVTGVEKPVEMNWRIRRGIENEPKARAKFEKSRGEVVQPVCAESADEPRLRASFDGISFDGLETMEVKCPDEEVHALAKNGEIVDYYKPQVAHQALVAWGTSPGAWPDNASVNFYSYDPEHDDGALVRLPASAIADFAAELYVHEQKFLVCVETGVPPCGGEFASLAAHFVELDAEVKRKEAVREIYKNALLKIGKDRDATVEGGGVSVIKVPRKGQVAWEKLAAEYGISDAEVTKYRKPDTTTWQVRSDPKVIAELTSKEESATNAPDPAAKANAIVAGIQDNFWGSLGQHAATH